MSQLSADKPRNYESNVEPLFNDHPVQGSAAIYEGSAVGLDPAQNRRAKQLADGFVFVGFADRRADNTLGANSAINVRVRSRGVIELPVTGAAQNRVGDTVWASDGDTFSMGDTGTDVPIGKLHRFLSTSKSYVIFEAEPDRSI